MTTPIPYALGSRVRANEPEVPIRWSGQLAPYDLVSGQLRPEAILLTLRSISSLA